MTKKSFPKSLHGYLSKLKRHALHRTPPPASAATSAAATTRLFSACKHPKTTSFDASHGRPADRHGIGSTGATLADVDRFLLENFRSLYNATGGSEEPNSFIFDSPRLHAAPSSDALQASDRFFVSPSVTGSLIEEARLSRASASSSNVRAACMASSHVEEARLSTTSTRPAATVPDDGVAVVTLSRDPYDDFRRSMQGMVDARHVENGETLDWDFMEELLFCYLEFNNRDVHKYILRAFVDLAASFHRRPRIHKERRRRRRVREGEVE